MQATRRYLWRAGGAGAIDVLFEDGRFFHSFDPDAPTPAAPHDCPPDTYRVRYDFTGWPEWQAEWRVTGPDKDYTMLSRFRPAAVKRLLALALLAACAPRPRSPTPAPSGSTARCAPASPTRPARAARSSTVRTASWSSRTTTRPSPPPGSSSPTSRSPASRTAASSCPRSSASGATAGASARPSCRAAAPRPRHQLEGRPQPGPPPHPHLLPRPARWARPSPPPPSAPAGASLARPSTATPTTPAAPPRLEPSPFLLLQELPGARDDMAAQSLAVTGGAGRRLLPAGGVRAADAEAEELLDESCR